MNEGLFLYLSALSFLLMLILAVIAMRSKDLIKSAILLAGVSLIASFVFVLLRAPDVAMAEASIGSALTGMIIVMAIRKTRRFEEPEKGGDEK
ncbi:MAG: hydrogenase subunit MbhD domain-containing protein [Candidatus Thermoplasmatota archaeon]|nr:hydrogenase subunit MbhD domain-containing protein [Candidatus Thermoplasmatota archaeon]